MTPLRVQDAMSRNLVTVPSSASVGCACDIVLARAGSHVVVVEEGEVLDIISAHLLTTALTTRLVARHQPLTDVLVEPVLTHPDTDLADAAALMLAESVDALGVVDDSDTLVG